MTTQSNGCIIAALDLTDGVQNVAERACLLAKALNCPVRLVHVLDISKVVNYANETNIGGLVSGEYDEKLDAASAKAREYIESRIANVVGDCGKLEIMEGKPKKALEELIEESQAMMIVLGEKKAIFGSVVKHMLHHAPCDVHIVRVN